MSYSALSKSINARGRFNTPGGSIVYLSEYDNVIPTGYTYITDASGNTYLSGITMVSGKKFYSVQVNRENINFTNKPNFNLPWGVRVYEPSMTFNLPGLEPDKIAMFDTLTYVPVIVIVKTKEDKYFLMFRENGGDLSTDSNQSLGLASVDPIGSVITIVGSEKVPQIQLDPTTALTIMAGIVG